MPNQQKIIEKIIDRNAFEAISLVSLMEPLRIFIETYEMDGETVSLAFLKGFPFTLDAFLVYLIGVFARLPSTAISTNNQQKELLSILWRKAKVNKDDEFSGDRFTIDQFNENMFAAFFLAYSELKNGNESFRDVIYRFDEDYKISILNPVRL